MFVDATGIDVELAGNDLIVLAVFTVLAAALLIRATARPRPLAGTLLPQAARVDPPDAIARGASLGRHCGTLAQRMDLALGWACRAVGP
jgi:hypothetical protein